MSGDEGQSISDVKSVDKGKAVDVAPTVGAGADEKATDINSIDMPPSIAKGLSFILRGTNS